MFQTLIVEDNVAFRQSIKEVLARRFPFMEIDEAVDGEQALREGTSHHHDLVFMDIKMAGPNGLDVTRAIKDGDHGAVVCIVTNYDLQEYREAAEDCGADHFLVKDESTEMMIVSLVESVIATRVKTLIIEDNDSFRTVLNDALVQQWPDMIVTEAADGPVGLTLTGSFKPDLVLLDLHLPSSNGLDLVAPIKAVHAQSFIVVITGYDLPEYREAASQSGVAGYITKDESVCDGVAAIVDRILARARLSLH